jgi:hypothetical protein
MADEDKEAEQIEEILRLMRMSPAEEPRRAMDGAKTPLLTDTASDIGDLRSRLADIENRLARLEERLGRAGIP